MRSKLAFPLLISLLLILVPGALAQKKSKTERRILGDELAFGRKAAEFGLWNEAIFRWKKVVDQDPNNSDALNNLAVAYESVGNYEKAGNLYQAALDLDEDSQSIRKNLKRFNSFYRKHRKQLERDEKIKARKREKAKAKKPADGSTAGKKAPAEPIHKEKVGQGQKLKAKKRNKPATPPPPREEKSDNEHKGGNDL